MTAKKKRGGRVTAKGTVNPVTKSSAVSAPATRAATPRFDPVKARQFQGHAGPSRSAHRGNR